MMKDLTEGNPQSLLWRFTIPMYFCSYIMLATFSDLILRVVLSFVFASFLRVCLFPGCDRSLAVLAVWMECGKRPVIMV